MGAIAADATTKELQLSQQMLNAQDIVLRVLASPAP